MKEASTDAGSAFKSELVYPPTLEIIHKEVECGVEKRKDNRWCTLAFVRGGRTGGSVQII